MFWWRKRNEGFEWRDYVRTTILVRREQRRQKVRDVQAAAAAHLKEAGEHGLRAGQRGLEAGISGARSAGEGLWHGLKAGATATASGTSRGFWAAVPVISALLATTVSFVRRAIGAIGAPLGPWLEPLAEIVGQPRARLVLAATALATGLGAAYRAWAFGFDADARVAAAVSLISLALLAFAYLTGPDRVRFEAPRESLIARLKGGLVASGNDTPLLPFTARTAGLATVAVAALAIVVFAGIRYLPAAATMTLSSAPQTTGALRQPDPSELRGRATAVAGDTLRLDGRLVVLDGIEAPVPGQICRRGGGTWRCGSAAKDALADAVRSRRITCEILGEADGGMTRARCRVGDTDLAEKLVRTGKVFAESGFMSRYADAESEAQDKKTGLWDGEADRPQDYRTRRWDEAKRAAPDGCPIKGRIRSGARTYVLPWSPSYDSVKVTTSKGERWFCSESEAQEAGWSLGSPS